MTSGELIILLAEQLQVSETIISAPKNIMLFTYLLEVSFTPRERTGA
jgi:hypothetical protein